MRTNSFHIIPRALCCALLPLLAIGSPAAALVLPAGSDGASQARVPQEPTRQFAQTFGRPPYASQGPRGRPVMDHDHAREGTRSGEYRRFDELLSVAQARGRGEYLGVEPDISRNIYRFKFMRPGGNVVWVDVDSRTARILSERD